MYLCESAFICAHQWLKIKSPSLRLPHIEKQQIVQIKILPCRSGGAGYSYLC